MTNLCTTKQLNNYKTRYLIYLENQTHVKTFVWLAIQKVNVGPPYIYAHEPLLPCSFENKMLMYELCKSSNPVFIYVLHRMTFFLEGGEWLYFKGASYLIFLLLQICKEFSVNKADLFVRNI